MEKLVTRYPYQFQQLLQSNSAGDALFGQGTWAGVGTGTAQPLNATAQGRYNRTSWQSAASTAAIAGRRQQVSTIRRYSGFDLDMRFGRGLPAGVSVPTLRAFVGLTSRATNPTNVDWSTQLPDTMGIVTDPGDVNYQFITRNATGTPAKVDTGIPKAGADEMLNLRIICLPGSDNVQMTLTRLNDGMRAVHVTPSAIALPSQQTLLRVMGYYGSGGTAVAIGFLMSHCSVVHL